MLVLLSFEHETGIILDYKPEVRQSFIYSFDAKLGEKFKVSEVISIMKMYLLPTILHKRTGFSLVNITEMQASLVGYLIGH